MVDINEVPMRRAGLPITNIFSALGDFKETRLTAALAYVIARFPQRFMSTFKIQRQDRINDVEIEHVSKDNRFDISIKTNNKIIIIEAKVDFDQNKSQVKRYARHLKKEHKLPIQIVLLDKGSFASITWKNEVNKFLGRRVKLDFVTWHQIHTTLKSILISNRLKKQDIIGFALAEELKNYLEVGGMNSDERKEVYTRDLSGESMVLFFRHHIYISDPKFFGSAKGNLYFAPYFTWKARQDADKYMLDIAEGISYIAPILDTRVLRRNEVKEYLISQDHPNPKEAAKMVLQQTKRGEIMILRLGKPVKLFLTPITKRKLGAGTGMMPSRSFTFAKLLEAASLG